MDRRTKKTSFYKNSFPLKNRIALTTGDPKGIGLFVAEEALKRLGTKKNFQFVVWTSKRSKTLQIPSFKTLCFSSSSETFSCQFKENILLQIKSSKGPGAWLLEAGEKALKKEVSALITGPVKKSQLKSFRAIGQTDLLKKQAKVKEVFMCFRGRFFNVILLTDHVPLKKVKLNKEKLECCLSLALSARKFLKESLQKKSLGVLALNPHAGEHGLLGSEEETIIKPFLKGIKEVKGPLSPDVTFLKKNWKFYSFFIALYHDQGLIPFKMKHNLKGFVQSLGLPFLRLGVDHGIGANLKRKDICSESFFLALKEALRLVRLYQK
ncbi:MAG: 4-hydroxythreonine-4-phosphate dehydrogenase PdxA [Bdellovibrionaceae bacterium]|nr:4-hydroxythreonine-4-phosphate dehydrogenase PdxA [Pseudobdellovibrionaceae bacterium]